MFRAIILPIFRSIRLCVADCGIMHPRCCRPGATGRHHRGYIIPQAVTHILVLLKMGKIFARNMLSWMELLINRYCCIYFVVYIIYINDARSNNYQVSFKTEMISASLFPKICCFGENFVLLGYYPALSCPETSVGNYLYSLPNNPEEQFSVYCFGLLFN